MEAIKIDNPPTVGSQTSQNGVGAKAEQSSELNDIKVCEDHQGNLGADTDGPRMLREPIFIDGDFDGFHLFHSYRFVYDKIAKIRRPKCVCICVLIFIILTYSFAFTLTTFVYWIVETIIDSTRERKCCRV